MKELIERQAAIDALINHEPTSTLAIINVIDKDVARAIIEELPSAEPEQKWIPCKTGILPEKRDEFYQATYLLDDGDRMVDYVYFNSKGEWSNYAYEYSELLAWMPLPEAYKGDK